MVDLEPESLTADFYTHTIHAYRVPGSRGECDNAVLDTHPPLTDPGLNLPSTVGTGTTISVRGTAWYSLATRGLVMGGGVGGGVGRMVHCNSYSDS